MQRLLLSFLAALTLHALFLAVGAGLGPPAAKRPRLSEAVVIDLTIPSAPKEEKTDEDLLRAALLERSFRKAVKAEQLVSGLKPEDHSQLNDKNDQEVSPAPREENSKEPFAKLDQKEPKKEIEKLHPKDAALVTAKKKPAPKPAEVAKQPKKKKTLASRTKPKSSKLGKGAKKRARKHGSGTQKRQKPSSTTTGEPISMASVSKGVSARSEKGGGGSALIEAIPLYQRNPPPPYPELARKRGYQGTVLIDVQVSAEGVVTGLKLHRSSGHKILDRAALKAVKKWRFIPGKRGDRPVSMWVRVPVRFVLK